MKLSQITLGQVFLGIVDVLRSIVTFIILISALVTGGVTMLILFPYLGMCTYSTIFYCGLYQLGCISGGLVFWLGLFKYGKLIFKYS